MMALTPVRAACLGAAAGGALGYLLARSTTSAPGPDGAAKPPRKDLSKAVYAGVDGGGTTWKVAISAPGDPTTLVENVRFPTTTPAETLGKIRDWLKEREYDALGIGSFGPIDATPGSEHYGKITTTPKPGWAWVDVVSVLTEAHPGVPCWFDTDVNAPAYAEFTMGVCRGTSATSCAYITVGTGIGVGLVVNSETVHGLLHPEGGHSTIRRAEGDDFAGTCPYHKDCAEGLAATGSLSARIGVTEDRLAEIPDEDPAWDLCAHALASLCANLILIASPEKIVLGGGVMNRTSLFPRIHKHVTNILQGYVAASAISDGIADYIIPPTWEGDAGLVGALALAQLALERENP